MTGVCGPTDPLALPPGGAFPDDFYQAGSSVRDLYERRDEFTVLLAPPCLARR